MKDAFNGFPAAVSAICAVVDGSPVGMIATSLTVGVSFDPPMVAFSVRKESSTWPVLSRAQFLGVSVLGEGQDDVCRQIASRGGNRFEGLPIHTTSDHALLLDGAQSWLVCQVVDQLDVGDHTVITLKVTRVAHFPENLPLVYYRNSFPGIDYSRTKSSPVPA